MRRHHLRGIYGQILRKVGQEERERHIYIYIMKGRIAKETEDLQFNCIVVIVIIERVVVT